MNITTQRWWWWWWWCDYGKDKAVTGLNMIKVSIWSHNYMISHADDYNWGLQVSTLMHHDTNVCRFTPGEFSPRWVRMEVTTSRWTAFRWFFSFTLDRLMIFTQKNYIVFNWKICQRRGERLSGKQNEGSPQSLKDISHRWNKKLLLLGKFQNFKI